MANLNNFSTTPLTVGGSTYQYFSLQQAAQAFGIDLNRLPYSIRILLEGTIRTAVLKQSASPDAEKLAGWQPQSRHPRSNIEYQPGRVLLQDLTGVPVIVDLASLRSAAARAGKSPDQINPLIPVDLVIDHSIQVDAFGAASALEDNQELEYHRNLERYSLLKWAQGAFKNLRIIPPATGICHQVNLEFLSRVALTRETRLGNLIFPDTVIGTDSHTTMVNGLGVLGWGVGGIEAIAAMLDQPVEALLPDVVGVHVTGNLPAGCLPTDVVLTLTSLLRKVGVVNKIIEFTGEALSTLTVADRAMISNMCPEYGATAAYFPVDDQTLAYLRLTGREETWVQTVEAYYRAQSLYRDASSPVPDYTQILELDLSQIQASLAGPKRPQDLVHLQDAARSFQESLTAPTDSRGYALQTEALNLTVPLEIHGQPSTLEHGSVVLAAITSCTNTSNPTALVAAALLAKKAVEKGLKVPAYTKTSFAPGSRVVTRYLEKAGLLGYLDALGFQVVGYGCTTCIGNSGPLIPEVGDALENHKLITSAVISGNRNFEGRVHPQVQANYLASPALVVAYALAGNLKLDLTSDTLGFDQAGNPVLLSDLWPTPQEIADVVHQVVSPELYRSNYARALEGDARWQAVHAPTGELYQWDPASTYLRETTFCDPLPSLKEDSLTARALAVFGDSITTDHISPAGSIAKDSPAAKYLLEKGVTVPDFNTYGTRRGNHEVMVRGTFANIRLKNLLLPGVEGPFTLYLPDGVQMTIFEASQRYRSESMPLIIVAGKEYGSGSSRDWAAKGPNLLGVKAIIAESFERIHRSNLVGMGILPLQFNPGTSFSSLGLTGRETFILHELDQLKPGGVVRVTAQGGEQFMQFQTTALINSAYELECLRARGMFQLFMK
jgi:aconitate hydratase